MELEEMIKNKYKFVLLRSPYELMEHELVQKLYPQVIKLKTTGYRQEYDHHVLPFDSSDFIASHLLMCEKTANGLVPVLGLKSVTLKKCDDHRIGFPMLGMMEGLQPTIQHRETILKMMEQYRASGTSEKLAYNGSFTILPQLREDKVLMKHLWDVTFSLITNYYIDYGIPHVIAVCATKFNVHKKKEKLGWNYIQSGEGTLEEYNCKALFGASLVPMELFNVKEKSKESSEKFKDMWDDRLILDAETLFPAKKAA